MYNILSVQTHIIRNIFLTAGKLNSWLFQQHCFYFGGESLFQKVSEKMENNSTLWKGLTSVDQEPRAVVVSRSNFWFQSVFPQKDEEEKFDNFEKFAEKSLPFFILFVCRCWRLNCQISIESVWNIVICSLNVLMTVLYLKRFSIL